MQKSKALLGCLGIVGALTFGTAWASTTTIDDFSTNDTGVASITTGSVSATKQTGVTVGSVTFDRQISLDVISRQPTAATNAQTAVTISNGSFSLSNDSGVAGDGFIAYTNFATPLDLSVESKLQLTVVAVDKTAQGTPVKITLTDSSSGTDSRTENANSAGQTLTFDFSGSSLDLAHITGVTVDVQGGSVVPGVDMQLDNLQATGDVCQYNPSLPADSPDCAPPVPGISDTGLTIALLGLPLIAGLLGGLRRRS